MSDRASAEPGARNVVLVVSAAVFFSVLNGSIVNVTLPTIGRDLGVEPDRLGWVITAYLLVYAVAIPFYGRLADQYGARRFFLFGQGVFAFGSLLCALASSYGLLVAARVVQAAGGAAIPGLGVTLASRAYPPHQRGAVLGFMSTTLGVGAAIGPTLGGVVADALGWHAVFAIGALAGLLVPASWAILPPDEGHGTERLDVWGGLFLALTVSGALFAATEGARGGWGSPGVLWAAATSSAALVALAARQATAASPFIPRDLLANGRYLALVATSFTAMGAAMGPWVGMPLLLSGVNGLSSSQIGLALLPNAALYAVLGVVAGRVVDRAGARLPVRAGLVVMLVGLVGLSSAVGSPAWVASALLAFVGVGLAFVNTPLSTAVSLVVGRERMASAQSINAMLFFLGGSFGTTLVSAAVAARGQAADALNPLHGGPGVGYSDAFLFLAVPLLVALALAAALPAARGAGPDASGRAGSDGADASAVGRELPCAGSGRDGARTARSAIERRRGSGIA